MSEPRSLRKDWAAAAAQLSQDTAAHFDRIAANRSRALTVVLEEIYQPHNGGAVVRACDNFGVQDLHVLTGRNRFQISPEVSLGAEHKLDIHTYPTQTVLGEGTGAATRLASDLKKAGYRVGATSLRPGCIDIREVPIDQPIALCFGTEEHGLSEELHQAADFFIRIPMYGMTQSYNISVSVALCLYELRRRLEQSGRDFYLDEEEQIRCKLTWAERLQEKPK